MFDLESAANAFFNGGALLPLGAEQGYKGFGLALILEIIAGILSRARMTAADHMQEKNAGFLLALNIKDYLPLENYFSAMASLIRANVSSRPNKTIISYTLGVAFRPASAARNGAASCPNLIPLETTKS